MIKTKRAYDPVRKSDGYRVLVDRLWPRGIKKERLAVQEWIRDLAPSAALRKFFGHDPAKWEEFHTRYKRELAFNKETAEEIHSLSKRARRQTVTLVYAAHDEKHNNALVLKEYLEEI